MRRVMPLPRVSRSPVRTLWPWLAIIAIAAPTASAMDLYIGTLFVRDDAVVLERCDLAQTRYVLRDAAGADAVAALRAMPPPASGFWYGEVIGDYFETADGQGLEVSAIDALTPGRSCHLIDALDALDPSEAADPASTPPARPAQ